MSIRFEVLEVPVSQEFYNWYPYIKDENLEGENHLWKNHLENALLGKLDGMSSVFITAKNIEKNEYAGVLWLTFPKNYPQMVHFGWFYTVPEYRGMGIGRGIMELCEKWEEENNIKVSMLPTNVKLMAYSSIYLKRGWKDTLVDTDNGNAFMVKEYEKNFYDCFSKEEGAELFDSVKYMDYIPLDYLVNREGYASRLYPLGITGRKRSISFEHDWSQIDAVVFRKNGVFKGIGVCRWKCDRAILDVIAYGDANLQKTLKGAVERFKCNGMLFALIHKDDHSKCNVFIDSGFEIFERDNDFLVLCYSEKNPFPF